MSSIVPPLDRIPKLPANAISIIKQRLDTQLNQLDNIISDAVKTSNSLSGDVSCDDPIVQLTKQQLANIQKSITDVQQSLNSVQTVINSVSAIVSTASTVKAAISAAQLLNPVTAPLFIAQQLTSIQDATIVNAIESLRQFQQVPQDISSRLSSILPKLTSITARISNIPGCNVSPIIVPESVINETGASLEDSINLEDISSEFYQPVNVSDSDIESRSQLIDKIISQQRDLLTSLVEAPSQVYTLNTAPTSEQGKPGDYAVDTVNRVIYGPKLSYTEWATGVNY
jgi:hypothetical protein